MTCSTFLPERLVHDDRCAVFHLKWKVTFLTRNVDVRPVQFER